MVLIRFMSSISMCNCVLILYNSHSFIRERSSTVDNWLSSCQLLRNGSFINFLNLEKVSLFLFLYIGRLISAERKLSQSTIGGLFCHTIRWSTKGMEDMIVLCGAAYAILACYIKSLVGKIKLTNYEFSKLLTSKYSGDVLNAKVFRQFIHPTSPPPKVCDISSMCRFPCPGFDNQRLSISLE